jgi:2-oxoisovalerate dehydrogenase E2 component (dihydrolipoyl transacylase)
VSSHTSAVVPNPGPAHTHTHARSYSHTLNLTPLLPYLQTLNPPSSSSKPSYLASDIPPELALDPIATSGDAARQKTTLLSFLVKGLLLAMEEHPILRARVKEKDGARWLDVARDGTIGVAVSGESGCIPHADQISVRVSKYSLNPD